MTYKFRCKKCGRYNRLKGSFNDRRELAEAKGELFQVTCSHCGNEIEVEPNSVTAREGKFLGLLFPLVFIPAILLGYLLFTNFMERSSIYLKLLAVGFALVIPAIVYSAFSKSERDKVRRFNRYRF